MLVKRRTFPASELLQPGIPGHYLRVRATNPQDQSLDLIGIYNPNPGGTDSEEEDGTVRQHVLRQLKLDAAPASQQKQGCTSSHCGRQLQRGPFPNILD